ncbi:MAG: hypothetical protein IKS96_00460 [Fibrobacter sp.]|nr:hypothetical protein [Fibrobacter sp.]
MDLEEIKRGLRAEIKKRENEQYATFQCNIRQMCKDVLAKLEEQESEIAELKEEIDSIKVKFKKFNDNVCKKIVDASRTMSAISQDAQMDFYEEFIKEVK